MSIVVVGSVAYDSVKTPFGQAKEALGGSATYFSVAASYFTEVNLVAVVGDDFRDEDMDVFRKKQINTEGLQRIEGGKTFRWDGEYGFDLNEAKTLQTDLNVFSDFSPDLPAAYRECDLVFLANIDPVLQRDVMDQVSSPKLIACDTMNFWIEGKLDELKETLKQVNLVIINEGEARELADESNLVKASKKICEMGPDSLIIKRGEYGAILFHEDTVFAAPAYPLEDVYDPTGAGDSFAGGVMGYLASSTDHRKMSTMRQAIIFGSVMASFNVEAFSLKRMMELTEDDIWQRFAEFKDLTHFETIHV
jgi:sugar/nucleoside kinase (ribokinase family)